MNAPDIPPPPQHPEDAKPKKKKKAAPPPPPPPPLEGDILPPVITEQPERRIRYSEVGPPLAFPLGTGAKVYRLARFGAKPPAIANHIDNPLTGKPISESLLMQYFGDDYKKGRRDGAEETLQSLHEQVTGENGAKRNVQAAIFRSQQQPDMIGFSNTQEVKHTIVEDKNFSERIENLDEQDILQLRAILAKRVESGDAAARAARVGRRKPGTPPDGEDAK